MRQAGHVEKFYVLAIRFHVTVTISLIFLFLVNKLNTLYAKLIHQRCQNESAK